MGSRSVFVKSLFRDCTPIAHFTNILCQTAILLNQSLKLATNLEIKIDISTQWAQVLALGVNVIGNASKEILDLDNSKRFA